MTVAHKNLTGADLHEVKGADVATSGQVPISNGAGSAPFGLIPASSLAITANPFGSALFHIVEQQPAGTSSAVIQATAWTTQLYTTTLTSEIPGASQSGGTITLPAGTYYIDAYGSYRAETLNASPVIAHSRLYNNTTASVLLAGPVQYSLYSLNTAAVITGGQLRVAGRFTLGGISSLLLQLWVSSQGNFAATSNAAAGGNVLYTSVQIWKVA